MASAASGSAMRAGGLGRALTDVLDAAPTEDEGPAHLFGVGGTGDLPLPVVEARLERALAVLAAAFPTDVVACRHEPPGSGPVVRVRSDEPLSPDLAFRLGALFTCSGDELLVVGLDHLGRAASLAVWRPHGTFSSEERAVVDAVAELTDR
jgi:hypothetical protein